MADLEELISKGEGLKGKKLRLFGIKVSGASIVATFALISTILGSLYGGLLMYQKVEGIANLDLDSIAGQMRKTSADVIRIEEHANSIKFASEPGSKNDIRVFELESRFTSFAFGGRTFVTMSQAFVTAAALGAIVTPADLYSASLKPAAKPAPLSITHSWPSFCSCNALSGLSATRCSPSDISFRVPTFKIFVLS